MMWCSMYLNRVQVSPCYHVFPTFQIMWNIPPVVEPTGFDNGSKQSSKMPHWNLALTKISDPIKDVKNLWRPPLLLCLRDTMGTQICDTKEGPDSNRIVFPEDPAHRSLSKPSFSLLTIAPLHSLFWIPSSVLLMCTTITIKCFVCLSGLIPVQAVHFGWVCPGV